MVEHVQGRTLLPVADHTERDWNSGGSYTGWRECANRTCADVPPTYLPPTVVRVCLPTRG